MDALEKLRAAVQRDPRGVAEECVVIADAARAAGDSARISRALSVLGRARLSLGEIDLAEADLRRAIEAADVVGVSELAADGHLGLAAVLSQAGRSAEAFAHLDETARSGSDRLQAYALLQRAVVERRLGRLPAALASFDAALPTLRRIGARVDIAKVLVNRGVVRTHLGDCDGAIADMLESGRLYAAEQDDFAVAQTRHGLGYAHARRGDLAQALQHYDAAHEIFARLGHDALEVDVDRAEVLLAAGLHVEAGELAAETARRLHEAGDHSSAAEVWLLRCQAALLDGDGPAAAAYAGRARTLYAEQGAVGWELAAHLEVLRCTGGETGELVRMAGSLAASGNARGAASALGLAALAACRSGALDEGSRLAMRCTRQATRLGLFDIRMQSAHARAACAAARGDVRTARRQVRSALHDLARHRTSLAATDARAAVAVHAGELAALGLRLALDGGSGVALLNWIELARAGRGKDPAPRPPADRALAAELTELRSVVARLNELSPADDQGAGLVLRQRDLERAIHRRQLRADGAPVAARAGTAPVGELRRALAGASLVELAAIDTRLIAVTVDRRPVRIADLGPARRVHDVVRALSTALRAAVTSPADAPRELLRRCLHELDAALVGPLRGDGPVVLVVPPALHVVPWHRLPCLAGRGVTVAPSATWWLSARSGPAPASGPAVLVAGPRLTEAEGEVRAIAHHYPGAAVLTGSAATTEAVVAAMSEAPVVHLACHGRVRHDGPLWSALELHDGPLYVHDLEQLTRAPEFMVLSGCETGVGVRAGDELLGLAATLLDRGTRTLVAAVCPIPDSPATRETMTALHERVVGGSTASAALAQLASGPLEDDRVLVASTLSCFGRD